MTIQSVITGEVGEKLAYLSLRNLGRVRVQPLKHAGDLVISGIRVEVKTAKLSKVNAKYQGWQFCLRRLGHTDISHSDFVLLICLNDANEAQHVFIIPVDILRNDRRKISIVEGKSTKWHSWKGRFDLIEAAVSENDLSDFDFDAIAPVEF